MNIITTSISQQRGATLMVSLVLLLVLTVIGISAVHNTSLQSRMSLNSQFQVQAHQVALSEINAQIVDLEQDLGVLDDTLLNGLQERTGDDVFMQPDKYEQTVSFEYQGEGLPPVGYSVDAYVGRLYELNSRAQLDNTGIFSDQTQGFNYAGPK